MVAPSAGLQLEEASMRKDVEFKTEDGVTLRGWLYLPDQARGRVPTIVMAHGYSAVKENYLDKYAEVFSAAGLGGPCLRQSQLRRQRRQAPPAHRSMASNRRLS